VLTAVREVQIPLVAALLLGAAVAKLVRLARVGSVADELGPATLFPAQLRGEMAAGLCVIELGLGLGLIATAGRLGHGAPATCIRLGVGLMFLVATSAMIELRTTKPDVGCGCFGDFSTAPVSGRTLARSALLAVGALSTIGLPAVTEPRSTGTAVRLLAIMAAELVVLGALSPELGEGLVKLGYSEPCELRALPAERTLAALRRSKQWRRHCGLITSDAPIDMWRELCWRYVVFPASLQGHPADVVFAVFLARRRPAIHVAMVDAATSQPLPWPIPAQRPASASTAGRTGRPVAPEAAGLPAAPTARPADSDLHLSRDV
jgi:Methylamine utilisation protein MauE